MVAAEAADKALFVGDVTYPDHAVVNSGAPFTKIWRFRNTGTTTWTNFKMAFKSGNALNGPSSVPVATTAPGLTVDVAVPLWAPVGNACAARGQKGTWSLRNGSGTAVYGGAATVVITVNPPGGPNLAAASYASSNPYRSGGYGGQCTAFAWGRANEVLGTTTLPRGNAQTWLKSWKAAGGASGSSPRNHSIAVWSGGTYGHVGFVESTDGSNVTLSEANNSCYENSAWGGGYDGSMKSLSTSEMSKRGKLSLLGYIYLDDVAPSAAPSRTFAAPLSYQSVRLGWNDNSANELGFRVFRWNPAGSGSWSLLASLGPNSVAYTDYGLQSSTGYYYMACSWNAANASGSGACDAYVYVSTPAPPPYQTVFLVDGMSSSTRPQGQAFTFTGAGFTPYGPVDRWLLNYATSTWTRLSPPLSADENGTVLWQYPAPCSSSSLGDYYVWIGDSTAGSSFGVGETVTPGTCP